MGGSERTASEAAYKRITEMAAELRRMTQIYGIAFRIETYISDAGETASESDFCCGDKKYRHDHFFNGRESFTNRHREVTPAEMELKIRFNGCDGDCFRCIYPDCLKPDHIR